MRGYVDRSQQFIDEGRSIVGDPVGVRVAALPTVALTEDDLVPPGLKAWAGRENNGFYVQGLVDAEGTTYISCILRGQCETREIPNDRALDAFLHPFAHGFSLAL